jgi:quercetin dioxygenase-like cupin family protein
MFSHANSHFRLPVPINSHKLLANLDICLNRSWKEHYNREDFSGNWQVISLRSQTGNAEDVLAHNSDTSFKDTPLLKECNYFGSLLDEMLFEKESVRLLRLAPGSSIKEHRDRGLAYRFDCFRLHIPIVTDARVEFKVGEHLIEMQQGECWYADFDLPHSVHNLSDKHRVHLVIDGKRNAWTDALFARCGYNFEEEKRALDYSAGTKKQIIEQLRTLDTPVARDLIKKLQAELKTEEKTRGHEL